MKVPSVRLLALLVVLTSLAYSQVEKLAIPAGTPEDKDLNLISSEQDAQKKLAMYQDFLAKYASDPMAVAYGKLAAIAVLPECWRPCESAGVWGQSFGGSPA